MNKLPSYDYASVLAHKFPDYFVEKIMIIRNDLTTEADVSEYHQNINTSPGTTHELHDGTHTTKENVSTLLSPMIGKSCILHGSYSMLYHQGLLGCFTTSCKKNCKPII